MDPGENCRPVSLVGAKLRIDCTAHWIQRSGSATNDSHDKSPFTPNTNWVTTWRSAAVRKLSMLFAELIFVRWLISTLPSKCQDGKPELSSCFVKVAAHKNCALEKQKNLLTALNQITILRPNSTSKYLCFNGMNLTIAAVFRQQTNWYTADEPGLATKVGHRVKGRSHDLACACPHSDSFDLKWGHQQERSAELWSLIKQKTLYLEKDHEIESIDSCVGSPGQGSSGERALRSRVLGLVPSKQSLLSGLPCSPLTRFVYSSVGLSGKRSKPIERESRKCKSLRREWKPETCSAHCPSGGKWKWGLSGTNTAGKLYQLSHEVLTKSLGRK